PNDLSKWLAAAEQGNLAVQQQRLMVEIARREVDRQRAGHLPTLNLVATAGRSSTLNSGAREISDDEKISLQLNVPIFEGYAVSSRSAEAAANHSATQHALETVRRGAVLGTQQAYLGVINGLSQIRTLQAAYQAAQSAVISNKDAFDVGVRLNVDVLNAQSQAFNTYRELNRARVDTLMAQLKLKAAVGSLGEDDVIAINSLLNPNTN
ncbi:MAG: TolC family protein, partial [Rhodoferax sp.]|uniref:TolC family protein n=1 Tax=Rhodoferax sp. TaxID=50421 RepID=UPI001B553C5B